MLSDSHRSCMQTKGVVIGRVLIGLLFFVSGLGMLTGGPAGTTAYFTSLGIPLAGLVVWLVIILKIAAGGAIVIGKRVGLAAFTLIAFTALATIIGHFGLGENAEFDMIGVTKNLAIIGGLLYMIAYGAGSCTPTSKNDTNVCSTCSKDESECICSASQD